MNRYQSYKPSGVEWVGEIPEDWVIGKLKHNSQLNISSVDKHIYEDEISVKVCNYTDVYYNEFISKSLKLRVGSCTPEEYIKNLLKKGDVIITKDSESSNDIGVPSIVVDDIDNVVCGYHLSIIKSNSEKLIGGYLFRQLQTKRVRRYFEVHSNGITRFGLGKSSVLDLPLILPPLQEQLQIVQFLDEKTELIDKLISTKERKITLLKEQRTSLINQVVTKGLNPNVKMKDSGVEWIGEIPEDWMMVSIKHLVSTKITDGPHETPDWVDDGVPFLSVESVQDNKLDFNKKRGYITEELHEIYSKKCKPKRDDIFIVKSGSTTGKSTIVETDKEFNIWSPLCIIRSNKDKILPRFFFNSIQSFYFRRFIELGWSFGTQPNIGMGVIENIKIVLPPLHEQQPIIDFLNKKTVDLDNLVDLEQKKIDLLKEYRQSLISEVVTGKVKTF
jgi:type I restriction enzyme S subunit